MSVLHSTRGGDGLTACRRYRWRRAYLNGPDKNANATSFDALVTCKRCLAVLAVLTAPLSSLPKPPPQD